MKQIVSWRNEQSNSKDYFDDHDYRADYYRFRTKDVGGYKNEMQYFAGSILEKSDPTGNTHNELRLFIETEGEPDYEVPKESYLHELSLLKERELSEDELKDGLYHNGPKVLFCITMYQESWDQILQSIAGCVRAILELDQIGKDKNHSEYTADKFGIVLICDGIDKLPGEFVEKLMQFGLFDPEVCAHTVAKYENREHVKKKFVKDKAPIASMSDITQANEIDSPEDYCCKEYKYATKNVGHIFGSKLEPDRLQAMFEEREEENFRKDGKQKKGDKPYVVNLHNGKVTNSPYKWIVGKILFAILFRKREGCSRQ
jgi:hypothetical protein